MRERLERLQRKIEIMLVLLVLLMLLYVFQSSREIKELELERVDPPGVALVGVSEEIEEKEYKAPEMSLVEREEEEPKLVDIEDIEVKEWTGGTSEVVEVEEDTRERYELGDVVEEMGVYYDPRVAPKTELGVADVPIDALAIEKDINFRTLSGGTLTSKSLDRTKETVIVVWSEYYPVSIESLKVWEGVYAREKENYNFIFLNRGYGINEDVEGVNRYVKKAGIDLPVYLDREMMFQINRENPVEYPVTYYVTKELDIHKTVVGKESRQEIEANLKDIPSSINREGEEDEPEEV